MLLFYLECMCKSIKSSYKAFSCVEIVYGQNVLRCTGIWPKRPGQNNRGQNVCPQCSTKQRVKKKSEIHLTNKVRNKERNK